MINNHMVRNQSGEEIITVNILIGIIILFNYSMEVSSVYLFMIEISVFFNR